MADLYAKKGDRVMLTYDAAVEWFGKDFLRLMPPVLNLLPADDADTDDPNVLAYGAKGMVKALREGPQWPT